MRFLVTEKPRSYIQLSNRWTSVLIFFYHEACKKYSIRNAQFDTPIRNLFSSKYPKSPSARVPHRTYGSFGVNNSKFCIFKTTKTWVPGILSRLSFGRMRTKNLLPVQRHNQRVRAENWQSCRNNNCRQISCAKIARVMTSLSFWRWLLDPVKKLLLIRFWTALCFHLSAALLAYPNYRELYVLIGWQTMAFTKIRMLALVRKRVKFLF